MEEKARNAIARRIVDAHFPKVKTLEEFEFEKVPAVPAALIRNLAEGGYLRRSEPVIFLEGETGTGKTHLAIGLAVAACRQRKRVRFTTAAALINDLIEAKNKSELSRITNRWTRYELIVIDEMGYVGIPESAVELLFQVISGRAERAAVIITTTYCFPNGPRCFPMRGFARQCWAGLTQRGAHHRDGKRIVPVPKDVGEKEAARNENQSMVPCPNTVGGAGGRQKGATELGRIGLYLPE